MTDPSGIKLNTDAAIRAYLAGGVPAGKLVMGVPFNGRGWQGVANINNGLYQNSTGVPPGTWEAGSFDYKDIKANYLPSYTRFWSTEAKVPWLYHPATGIMISYDDPESLGYKADYIKNQQLAGAPRQAPVDRPTSPPKRASRRGRW